MDCSQLPPRQQHFVDSNIQGNLFSGLFQPRHSFYVPDFSGRAFENWVRNILLTGFPLEKRPAVFNKLHLKGPAISADEYEIKTTNNGVAASQIDIIVTSEDDTLVRVIECKWVFECKSEYLLALKNKHFPIDEKRNQSRLNALVISAKPSPDFYKKAQELEIILIELEDLT